MKILIIGNIGSGKTTLGKAIQELMGFKFIQIDELREKYLKGKVSEEYFCLHKFLEMIEVNDDLILEFTGVGCHKYAVKRALELSKDKVLVLLCNTRNFNMIMNRAKKKTPGYVSPFFSEIKDHIQFVEQEIQENLRTNYWKSNNFKYQEVYMDTQDDLEANMELIKELVN